MSKPWIIIIDRSRLFREGMRSLFESAPFSVLIEGPSLAEMLPKLQSVDTPDACILLEWFPEDEAFLRDVERLNGLGDYKIVALGSQLDTNILISALSAGARALVLRDISHQSLILSLMLVRAGEVVFPTELASYLLATLKLSVPAAGSMGAAEYGLTEKEVQILQCLIQGQPNKVIANKLALPEATVKFHLKGLLKKVNVTNRTEAAIWGLTHGLGIQMVPDCTLRSTY